MALPDFTGTITITAPAATDGRGEVAVLNTTGANFVGYLADVSGFDGPEVRTNIDNIPVGHGAVLGSFFYGPRSFTLEVHMVTDSTFTLSNARLDKLYRATNAMAADGTISWAESGVTKTMNFRRQQPPRGPAPDRRVLLSLVASDPRIYSTATLSGTPVTNLGTVGSPPTFTFTPSGNGTVILTNTTTSQALTLNVGTGGLSTGTAVTVNFKDKTVTQGGTLKPGAVSFPSSVWWELIPGSNSWTRTGTASITVAAALSANSAWI